MALWCQIRRAGVQRLVLHLQYPNFLSTALRSFGVRAQAKQEEEPRGPRINGEITASHVRLVTDEGHGVVSMWEALDRAKRLNLDLVEVQRTADPPVCKLMDFHKERFRQEVKEKERAKNKSMPTLRNGENKEVRFTAKTESKDLKIKADTITRLMERGYRVKCTVLPSGKEEEDLRGLLSRILALIEDIAIVESGPHVVDTKQAYVILRHVMFSTKKSGKKAVKALDAVSGVQNAVIGEPEGTKSSIQEAMPHQSDRQESTEWSSGTGRDGQVDHSTQKARFKVSNSHGDLFGLDAKRNKVEDSNRLKPSQQNPVVSSQSEPSVVEVNRYAKPSEPNKLYHNRERMPPQSTRTANDPRAQYDPRQRQLNSATDSSAQYDPRQRQFNNAPNSSARYDPRQRQFNNATNPSSSSSGYGRFNVTKPGSFDQRNSGALADKSRNAGTPSYEASGMSKTVPSSDQRNSRDVTTNPVRTPSFFSSTDGSDDQSSAGNAADKSGNAGSPGTTARSYGIFSAVKSAGSGDQKGLKVATSDGTSNSSAGRSYGVFSKPRAGASGV